MKFDLHTHHFRCGHADGNIRDYIEAAIAADLQVIGISDHTPYFGSPEEQPFPAISMAKADFAGYVQEVLDLKREYEGKIKVLLGIESDYFPNHAQVYQQALTAYPLTISSAPSITSGMLASSIKPLEETDPAAAGCG